MEIYIIWIMGMVLSLVLYLYMRDDYVRNNNAKIYLENEVKIKGVMAKMRSDYERDYTEFRKVLTDLQNKYDEIVEHNKNIDKENDKLIKSNEELNGVNNKLRSKIEELSSQIIDMKKVDKQ